MTNPAIPTFHSLAEVYGAGPAAVSTADAAVWVLPELSLPAVPRWNSRSSM